MENKNTSSSSKLKNAICYIPLGWAILFFTEENKSPELIKHIKYWTFLFIAFVLIRLILVWILMIPLSGILFLLYAWIAGFFWFKAHSWKDVNIEYIDEFEKKFKDNLNDSNNNDKNEVKKEESKNEKKDDDILDF